MLPNSPTTMGGFNTLAPSATARATSAAMSSVAKYNPQAAGLSGTPGGGPDMPTVDRVSKRAVV